MSTVGQSSLATGWAAAASPGLGGGAGLPENSAVMRSRNELGLGASPEAAGCGGGGCGWEAPSRLLEEQPDARNATASAAAQMRTPARDFPARSLLMIGRIPGSAPYSIGRPWRPKGGRRIRLARRPAGARRADAQYPRGNRRIETQFFP